MKKIILLLLVIVLVNTATAQQVMKRQARPGKNKATPEQKAHKQSERMEKELALSADQKTKVYAALLNKNQKAQEIRKKYPKGTADNTTKKEEMKLVRKTFTDEMSSILSAEQQNKWKEYREKKKGGMKRTKYHQPAEEMKRNETGN